MIHFDFVVEAIDAENILSIIHERLCIYLKHGLDILKDSSLSEDEKSDALDRNEEMVEYYENLKCQMLTIKEDRWVHFNFSVDDSDAVNILACMDYAILKCQLDYMKFRDKNTQPSFVRLVEVDRYLTWFQNHLRYLRELKMRMAHDGGERLLQLCIACE